VLLPLSAIGFDSTFASDVLGFVGAAAEVPVVELALFSFRPARSFSAVHAAAAAKARTTKIERGIPMAIILLVCNIG
jgi:hypothetical protein